MGDQGMRFKTRVLAAASTVAMAGGLVAGMAGMASATAPPPVNVANNTVTCDSVTGSVKFSPSLSMTGSTTTPTTISFNTKIGGCVTNNAGVTFAAGQYSTKGIVNLTGNNCTALLGADAVTTGTPLTTVWKVAPGTAKLLQASSAFSMSSIVGGIFSPGGSWGASGYGDFQSTSGMSVNGAFTGGDSGHSSHLEMTTGQSIATLLGACTATSGLKQFTIGFGNLTLG
jgi:hypothetical protein